MQSLASLMSVNTIGDIAPLEDFDEEEEGKISPFHQPKSFD